MTGKIWIFSEIFHDLNEDGSVNYDSVIDYIEHDYPKESSYEDKGWFFGKFDCENNLVYQSVTMEQNQSTIECVDRCFCGLYRIKIIENFNNKNYNRAWLLFIAGFHRMVKDKISFLYPFVKFLDKVSSYVYRGIKWVAPRVRKEKKRC